MNIRDRIIDFRRVKASELRPSPKNWRTHPQAQQDALRGILAEVGYVDALLARPLPDGTLELVDGHLRAETTPEMEVPVLVCDLDDAEAAKVLATFDPLSAMAESNAVMLDSLLAGLDVDSESLRTMLADIAPPIEIEFDSPPSEVSQNVEEIESIKAQRKKGNQNTESKNDTEKYLVIVFSSREEKCKKLAELGLPDDERYVPAAFVDVKAKGIVRRQVAANGRAAKAASSKKSGAGG